MNKLNKLNYLSCERTLNVNQLMNTSQNKQFPFFFSNKYKLYIKLFWKRNNLFTYFHYLIIKTLSHVKYLHVIVKHYSVWVWFKHKVDLSAIYSVGIIAIVISVWLTIDILCRQDANSNEPAMIITHLFHWNAQLKELTEAETYS